MLPPVLPNLSNSATRWWPSIQICEPMGAILDQITTMFMCLYVRMLVECWSLHLLEARDARSPGALVICLPDRMLRVTGSSEWKAKYSYPLSQLPELNLAVWLVLPAAEVLGFSFLLPPQQGYCHVWPCLALLWVLGIQTQILLLLHQVYLPLSYFSSCLLKKTFPRQKALFFSPIGV